MKLSTLCLCLVASSHVPSINGKVGGEEAAAAVARELKEDKEKNTKYNNDKNKQGGDWCSTQSGVDKEHNICKEREEKWSLLKADNPSMSFYSRDLTGECGPNCRPSCVTLMLDAKELFFNQQDKLKCSTDELCKCETSKCNQECSDDDKDKLLYDDHPKCFLEETRCLGPTLYDDYVGKAKSMLPSESAESLKLDQCTYLPDDEFYCRFKDFPLITPKKIESSCNELGCDDMKIYFEYCNVVEEDQNCHNDKDHDECENEKCARSCPKVVEPFPSGEWTTFVVSAPVLNIGNQCGDLLELDDVGHHEACFLQRVDIYYPPVDECNDGDVCSDPGTRGCPHCHDCPLLSLGDKIGALEVVGFGQCFEKSNRKHQSCAACDIRDRIGCKDCTVDCQYQENCHLLEECDGPGTLLNISNFVENDCSFCL